MIGQGNARDFALELKGLPPRVRVRKHLLDREHGWAEGAWRAMGAPAWPKSSQLAELRQRSEPHCTTQLLDTESGCLSLKEKLADLGSLFIEIETA